MSQNKKNTEKLKIDDSEEPIVAMQMLEMLMPGGYKADRKSTSLNLFKFGGKFNPVAKKESEFYYFTFYTGIVDSQIREKRNYIDF